MCRICRHYNRHICVLQDLDPCEFLLDEKKASEERAKSLLLAGVVVFALLFSILALVISCAARKETPKPEYQWSAVELLKEYHGEETALTEWQKLQLAIVFTESKGDPNAVGSSGDLGVYQMIGVFVEEANRVSGSNYTHEDAKDINKAIDIFNRVQDYYNKEHDVEEAIKHHNHGSAYRATVLRNLELVERMETFRQKLIEYGD